MQTLQKSKNQILDVERTGVLANRLAPPATPVGHGAMGAMGAIYTRLRSEQKKTRLQ